MDRAATPEQPRAARVAPLTGGAPPLRAEAVTWTGDGHIIGELLADDLPASAGSIPDGRTSVVKSGPHRAVYRIVLPSGTVFLKHFKTPDWRALARNLVLRSPAEREAAAAAHIAAAGIDTTSSAALGIARRRGVVRDSFLVTHEIADARPLDQVLRELTSTAAEPSAPLSAGRFRRQLVRALGQLAGRLHHDGLTHGDLHPANILVRIRPDGAIRLSLIDLQRVRRLRILPFQRARKDLFGLYNSFNGTASRADRRRFLAAYWIDATAAGSRLLAFGLRRGGDPLGKTARRLEAFCLRALRREQIQNDRKWQRPHRRLIVADQGWQQARGLSVFGPVAVRKFRDDPDTLFQAGTIRFWRLRSSESRAAVVDLAVAGNSVTCEVRETRRPLGWRDLFSFAGRSETRRAWEMGHALLRRRIGTVRPLLYVRSRTVACVREFLVTEPADGMVTLAVFLAHRLPGLDPAEREDWIDRSSRQLAGQLVRLHQYLLVHGKLSADNLLVGVERNDDRIRMAAVQHILQKRRIVSHDLVAELACLQASLAHVPNIRIAHKARFLRTCFRGRFGHEARRVWRAVAAEASAAARMSPTSQRSINALNGRRGGTGRAKTRGAALARTAMFLAMTAAISFCGGCNAVDRPVALPVRYSVPGDQLLVLSDFKLQKDHELIRELNGLREQVTNILELPVKRDPVVVYLFNNETEYRRYMNATYPRLPPRSAYFVGTSTELAVYTHWGQNVREDLRHEYTHGLLHSGLKRVPLWLDEGLAEYFEVAGPRPGGINHDYADRLAEAVASGWRPDLKRLENLDDSGQMKRADYQESWAWVHFLLNSTPDAKSALVSYLGELRTNAHPKTISYRLRAKIPEYDTRFVSYISQLKPAPQAVGAL